MRKQPAYLQGAGIVTCLGEGLAAQREALLAGRPGPTRVPTGDRVPPQPCHVIDVAGDQRMYAFIEGAVTQALSDAQLPTDAVRRMAVLIGSSCLDLPLHEDEYVADSIADHTRVHARAPGFGKVTTHVAQHFDIDGPQYMFNTACSSSANALMYARLLLDAGVVEHALVIGVEAYNRLSVAGFGSLMLLSKQGYRPFDQARDGLVLGEGAAALVLGRAPRADLIGTSTVHAAALVGAASACDPSSPTNSQPERIAQVMSDALNDADLSLMQLVAIKAHGTGTPSNDLAEGQAMRSLGAPLPPFTSLKPYIGHTLGGCGVIESLLVLTAWQDGFLPATPGFITPDPDIGMAPVTTAHALPEHGAVLCNFFGFGGNNTSLVWSRT